MDALLPRQAEREKFSGARARTRESQGPAGIRKPRTRIRQLQPTENGVIAFFGSEGLYSYTLDGKLEWQKDSVP